MPQTMQHDANNVMTWTAERLTADSRPAYGSDRASNAEPPPAGGVYDLPRRRIALDWSRACKPDQDSH